LFALRIDAVKILFFIGTILIVFVAIADTSLVIREIELLKET